MKSIIIIVPAKEHHVQFTSQYKFPDIMFQLKAPIFNINYLLTESEVFTVKY